MRGCVWCVCGGVTEGSQTFKIKNRPSHHEIVSLKQF